MSDKELIKMNEIVKQAIISAIETFEEIRDSLDTPENVRKRAADAIEILRDALQDKPSIN